jgi:CBS domain-containing protein
MLTQVRTDPAHSSSTAERLLGDVGAAMTRTVVSISPDASLGVAARVLERAGLSGAPVVQAGTIVGVVTVSDLLARAPRPIGRIETTGPFHRVEPVLAEISRRTGATVRDVMTSPVVTVTADTSLVSAARTMAGRGINRLPVVDEAGHACGVLTRDDIVAAVGRLRETETETERGPAPSSQSKPEPDHLLFPQIPPD